MAKRMLIAIVLAAGLAACDDPNATKPAQARTKDTATRIQVRVDGEGYHPSRIESHAGQPVTLVFRRVEDVACAKEIVVPSEDIRKPLPLDQDVEITLTPSEAGELAFTCGMDMLRGSLVVK